MPHHPINDKLKMQIADFEVGLKEDLLKYTTGGLSFFQNRAAIGKKSHDLNFFQ